jgi:Recombination endonuclease VII
MCPRCGKYPRRRYPCGQVGYCKKCDAERTASYRNSKRPELRLKWVDSRSKCLYGVTTAEREALFQSQGCKCAVCGTTEPGSKHGWCVDHSHVTGGVRGIVCQPCNSMLGFAKDSAAVLLAGATYLQIHAGDPVREKAPSQKSCVHCGKMFQPHKFNIYCSGACRQAAYKKRKRATQ